MSKIELINHQISGMMVYHEIQHPAHDVMSCLSCVIDKAQDVHALDPIDRLDWIWNVDHYDFTVTMADARLWQQTIRPGNRVVWMTYDVPDAFSSVPMAAAQILRKELIKISAQHKVAYIELIWL